MAARDVSRRCDATSWTPTVLNSNSLWKPDRRYWGLGVTPGFRGYRLYDGPESKALLKRWVDWGNAHRKILHADLLHLKRPDGSGYDAMMHVDAEPPLSGNSSSVERALLMVFNQSPHRLNTTLTVPLYFAGLSSGTNVAKGSLGPSGHPVDLPGGEVWQLRRDWTVQLPITVEPSGIAWYIFTDSAV